MQGTSLAGHCVLFVEDEPLVALDIRSASERAAASVISPFPCRCRPSAEQTGWSGAVLGFGLASDDADALCGHLKQHDIPCIRHSGSRRPRKRSWRLRSLAQTHAFAVGGITYELGGALDISAGAASTSRSASS
jgi:hypothetical protein